MQSHIMWLQLYFVTWSPNKLDTNYAFSTLLSYEMIASLYLLCKTGYWIIFLFLCFKLFLLSLALFLSPSVSLLFFLSQYFMPSVIHYLFLSFSCIKNSTTIALVWHSYIFNQCSVAEFKWQAQKRYLLMFKSFSHPWQKLISCILSTPFLLSFE